MRIGRRMFLALLPAVLGVFTVASLAYWGRYAHAAPEWLITAAALAAVASFAVAWLNTRYVVRRIEALATSGVAVGPDELETIASTVHDLSSAVDKSEAARRAERDTLREQKHGYAELLSLASHEALQRLDEIRLPLHILLENHFGDLNENQEEMLSSARAAAEQAGDTFQRLVEIADLDRGKLPLRRDRVRPGDLISAVLPALVAEGEERDVRVIAEVAPALQSILGDRGRLQLALELLLRDALRRTSAGSEMRISAEVDGAAVVIGVEHGSGEQNTLAHALGDRLIDAQGGGVAERQHDGRRRTEIRLARASS